MSKFAFDDRDIRWKSFDGVDHLWFSVLDIDDANKIIHVLYKFAGNRQIVLHRHKTLNKTMVIQGEHRLYHANGELKEVRPVGSYTVSPPSDDPHREGGGDRDVVVLFTIYGDEETLYEILDDDLNVAASLTAKDFASFYERSPRLERL
ncbi:MAG: regulator [Methylocystaceae bacterium]|nr:MAG: regulator [Methylocystaceae bacterium]